MAAGDRHLVDFEHGVVEVIEPCKHTWKETPWGPVCWHCGLVKASLDHWNRINEIDRKLDEILAILRGRTEGE